MTGLKVLNTEYWKTR
ncbi:hypothetical protein CFP56_038982 [Quercus suber]|uniref:Uncharacterized protein n=1 Tax=Quercus suber TaxID=58331 RepID=A0AAW0J1V2_QUESU